jgi:hypothetical protein
VKSEATVRRAHWHGANPDHWHPHVRSALQHDVYKTCEHEVHRDVSLLVQEGEPPSFGAPQTPALHPPPSFVQSLH